MRWSPRQNQNIVEYQNSKAIKNKSIHARDIANEGRIIIAIYVKNRVAKEFDPIVEKTLCNQDTIKCSEYNINLVKVPDKHKVNYYYKKNSSNEVCGNISHLRCPDGLHKGADFSCETGVNQKCFRRINSKNDVKRIKNNSTLISK